MARILIAEDDASTAALYRKVLENREHLVLCVETGESLLASLDGFKPDMVILDILLPGLSGLDTCRELRKNPAHHSLPVLMVSSQDEEQDIIKGFDCGADEYILKPVRKNELTSKVDILLRRLMSLNRPAMAPNCLYDGRFLILNSLGRSDETAVYLAKDNKDDPPANVALKILCRKGGDDSFVPRFLREIGALSKLNHPNIVKVVDYKSEADTYYYASEFIAGRSLSSLVNESPLDETMVVAIGLELVGAFAQLEENCMVHRDIKPDNIVVSDAGVPVLIDFGLAKESGQKTLTLKDQMYGTPQFVSPEYIKGVKFLDIKTDIYSLGVTFYYALTGVLPFSGDNHMTIFHKHLTEVPPSLVSIRSGVSKELSDLVDGMLVKTPARRCGVAELRDALQACWDRMVAGGRVPQDVHAAIRRAFFSGSL